MAFRIFFSILVLFSLLFLPFWISIALTILGITYFDFYFEGVILIFLLDLLYGVKEVRFFNLTLLATIIILIFFLLKEIFKKKFKFYKND